MKKKRAVGQNKSLILDLRPVAQKPTFANQITNIARKNRRIAFTLVILVVAVMVTWALSTINRSLEQIALSDAKTLIGSHMILPTDEEPTLLAVEDNTQVKDPFIAEKSKNGDQILIYAKNHIAIIYRPSVDRIVAAGDLFADPGLVEADGATIAVLDGTGNPDKTRAIIVKLEILYPKADIIEGGKANKQDFTTTIVIDNSQTKDNLVESIAQNIQGKRGIVPISESITTTDLMIIVGKD